MDLKNKPGEFIFIRTNISCRCSPATGYWRDPDKSIQHFLNAKIVDGATEEYRRNFSFEIVFIGELAINAIYQFNIFPERGRIVFTQLFIKQVAAEIGDLDRIFFSSFCISSKQQKVFIVEVVYSLKILTAIDGPCHRVKVDVQFFFDLFQQIKPVLSITVHFVDKY